MKLVMNDDILRAGVALLKHELYRGGSDVFLPADSFLENAVLSILELVIEIPPDQAQG